MRSARFLASWQKLDELHVSRTNINDAESSRSGAVRAYEGLAKIERAFLGIKLGGLDIRPVYLNDDYQRREGHKAFPLQ